MFYHQLQERYGWTVEYIDGADLCFVLDQYIAADKAENPDDYRKTYIEDVIF